MQRLFKIDRQSVVVPSIFGTRSDLPPETCRQDWVLLVYRVLWVLLLLVVLESNASAQSDDPFDQLRVRIEKLEQDNQDLRAALSQRPSETLVPLVSDLPPTPDEQSGDGTEDPDQQKFGSVVQGYMKRLSSQSQEMAELQNQRMAALESSLGGILNKPGKGTAASGNYGATGLVFTSADGNFKTHFGGTIHLDFIAPQSTANGIGGLGGPNTLMTQDSTDFRRLRFRADGTMYHNIDWVSEFDFSFALQNTTNLTASLADNGLRSVPGTNNGGVQGGNSLNVIQPTVVWMNFKDVPVAGNIRVGNQQDWLSIEHVTSARYLDFMERAPIMDVFTGANNNGYTPGVSFFNNTPDKSAGLQLGIYKNNLYDSGYTFSTGNAFMYGGRAIWTPYYDECSNGRYLVHTGLGAEYRTFNTTLPAGQDGTNVRLRSRGDLRIASSTLTPNFVDTGNFFAEGQTLVDPEIAVVWGPWTFQAEYTAGWFNGAKTTQLAGGQQLNNIMMSGGYVEALYFFTGENKTYNRQTGLFAQVVPLKNFKPSEGTYGAWQGGVRYDWMDLNSGLVTGGMNQNSTVGLNWFLNPNVRFQFNTVFSYIDNNTGAVNPALNAVSVANGSLQGSRFNNEGLILTVGTRMDISF